MKKLLYFFTLFLSLSFSVQAGYVIRGIYNSGKQTRLENYTLTFDDTNRLISAGSMRTTFAPGYGTMRNTIVLISASSNISLIFPVILGDDGVDVEVRDFHYLGGDRYVMCGTRTIDSDTCAFVAIVSTGLSVSMSFYEYPDADIFYSICQGIPSPSPIPGLVDFYACGAKVDTGVIVHLDQNTLQPLIWLKTEIPWVYHKIISKPNPAGANLPHLIVSGRDPDCNWVGFTEIYGTLSSNISYRWQKQSELDAHSVVCDNNGDNIVLATSKDNIVTLYPVAFPQPTSITAYKFTFAPELKFYIQDVNININNILRPSILLVGYMKENYPASWHQAWFGYVSRLTTTISMFCNNYGASSGDEEYEHYKIRFHNNIAYTGGKVSEGGIQLSALFGNPLNYVDDCDNRFESLETSDESFPVMTFDTEIIIPHPASMHLVHVDKYILPNYDDCLPFKGGDNEPEYSMLLPENETEITNFYDRITVKDTPFGTNYQIYSVTGQLIKTGATNPDIYTAQLSKGMYILRLETGKAFKFVK